MEERAEYKTNPNIASPTEIIDRLNSTTALLRKTLYETIETVNAALWELEKLRQDKSETILKGK